MHDPELSRREFLRGSAIGTGALASADLYNKVVATAGGIVGGLIGILGTALAANSNEIRGIQELRQYAEKVYKEADEITSANISKFGLVGHYRKEPDIFDDYIDGRRVQVRVRSIGIDEKGNNLYDLETRIFDPANRRAGMPYDNRFDINDNERFWDREIKGNLLGHNDFVHIKKGDSKNWESAIVGRKGGYQLKHWRTLRKGEVCKNSDPSISNLIGDHVHLGVCLDGTAFYSPGGEATGYPYTPPELRGHYKTITHPEIQKRLIEDYRKANEKYQRLLQIVINQLVKEGKLKINKVR